MARTPFKLKSGNNMTGSSFKMMGSSPIRGKKEDKAKLASMQATHSAVTADMTDKELRDLAVKQHAGKANKFNVDFDYLKKLRSSRKSSSESAEVVETPTTTETSKMSEGEFKWYGQSGGYDPRLTRDETYEDYAYSIDKDKHPEGLLKSK